MGLGSPIARRRINLSAPDAGATVASIGLDPLKFGAHSLRRTKATLIYRRNTNRRAVGLLLGHTKIEGTVRYLGIGIDDAMKSPKKSMSEIPGQGCQSSARIRRSDRARSRLCSRWRGVARKPNCDWWLADTGGSFGLEAGDLHRLSP
jgi:hypothetical protein